MVHTDRVRIQAIAGCAFRCRFCDLPYTTTYSTKSADDLVAAARLAISDAPMTVRHLLLSGGTPTAQDREYLLGTIDRIVPEFREPVDVMMVPMFDRDYLHRLRSAGIRDLYLNLEIYNEATARKMMPQKAAAGRSRYMTSLREAVSVLGPGHVESLVLVGLEPISALRAAVRTLVDLRVIPVLSPFRPSPQTPLAALAPPSVEFLEEAWNLTSDVCKGSGLRPGPVCIPCQHNTLTFPDSSGFYV
jgi:radical SAM superfamily enzyme YgiQ (UPF0313 family)